MTEKVRSPEERGFEVTDIEQLKDYNQSLWPMTEKEANEAEKSGKLKEMREKALAQAEKTIKEKGGLTFSDLESLGFFKKDDPRHRTDI